MKKLLIGLFSISSIIFASEPPAEKFIASIFSSEIKEPITPHHLHTYCQERIAKADAILQGTLEGGARESELHQKLNPNWMGNDQARLQAHYYGFCRLNWKFPDTVYENFKSKLRAALLERAITCADDTTVLMATAEHELGEGTMDHMLAEESKGFAQAILRKLNLASRL